MSVVTNVDQLSPSDRALQRAVDRYLPDRDGLIVELGSGWGRITRQLVDAGYRNILCVDFWEGAPAALQDVTQARFAMCDLTKDRLPVDDSHASVILCIHLIEHMVDPTHMLKEARRALRPGGVLVLFTPDFARSVKTFYTDPQHIHPYIPVGLKSILEYNGFRVIELKHLNVRRPFGRLAFLWRRFERLIYTGNSILAIATPAS
jgi:SAM-dependent methyltransferase